MKTMRTINWIVVHCSATKPGSPVNAGVIDRWHRQRGWKGIGYHYVVLEDGTVEEGRPLEQPGAHCAGRNADSVGVCYTGGLDAAGRPADTRTAPQRRALAELLRRLTEQFPQARIIGHRDASPDRNGNGRVDPEEYVKACPCFDVRRWVAGGMLGLLLCLTTGCRSVERSGDTERGYVRTDSLETAAVHRMRAWAAERTEQAQREARLTERMCLTVGFGADGRPERATLRTRRTGTLREQAAQGEVERTLQQGDSAGRRQTAAVEARERSRERETGEPGGRAAGAWWGLAALAGVLAAAGCRWMLKKAGI